MLCGPGSIQDAHTDHEKIGKQELERAVATYVRAALWSLERDAGNLERDAATSRARS